MTAHAGLWGTDSFVTTSGRPVPAGTQFEVRTRDTDELATLYVNADRTDEAPNPGTIGTNGNLAFYADPALYNLVIGDTSVVVAVPLHPLDIPTTAADVGADPAGTATAEVTALPEMADGIGILLDLSTPGLVSFDAAAQKVALANSPSNTLVETSLLGAPIPVENLQLDTGWRLVLGGTMNNTSGAAVDVTIRVKLGAIASATFAASIPAHASQRMWNAQVDAMGTEFFGNRFGGMGRVSISAPGSSGFDLGSMTRALVSSTFTLGDDANLDVTVQFSTAAGTISTGATLALFQRMRVTV